MNNEIRRGIWLQLTGTLRQAWACVIADPRAAAKGRRDRLAGRVEEQRGLSKQAADRQLAEFMHRNRKWWDLSGR
jgi:uncharacterized protein YjbJ (UPF0337 family)